MAERLLEKRVIVDKECVTYRLLSRLLNVHVNEAKRQLQLFHDSDKHKTHATYIVNGTLPAPTLPVNGHKAAALTSEADEMAIDEKAVTEQTPVEVFARTVFELVQEEELEECKAKFDKIKSVFIYSLQPKRLIDISLVCASNATIHTDDRCKMNIAASKKGSAFGVIQLPPRKAVAGNKKPAPPSSPPPSRPIAGPSKTTAAKPKVESKPASTSTTSAKRKAEPAPTVKAEPVEATVDKKGKGKAAPSSDAMGMDWDEAAEEEMMMMEREAMGLDESMDVDAPEAKPSSASKVETKRIRKKRMVKKTVRDAKGSRRTEEVEESYSEDEEPVKKPSTSAPAPPAKKPTSAASTSNAKKPTPAPAKKPAADASGQTSLKNFFAQPKKGKR